jgi:hypothetical protein
MRAGVILAIAALGALLLTVTHALAQPAGCIDETAAWSVPYQTGSIKMTTYYVWQQAPPGPAVPPPLLAVSYFSGAYNVYQGVPQNVAQRFFGPTNADPVFSGYINNRYYPLLLSDGLCPLRNETGNTYLLQETK